MRYTTQKLIDAIQELPQGTLHKAILEKWLEDGLSIEEAGGLVGVDPDDAPVLFAETLKLLSEILSGQPTTSPVG
jgi:hypothetical protein